MKAAELRETLSSYGKVLEQIKDHIDHPTSEGVKALQITAPALQVVFLCEIAAQLADLNEHLNKVDSVVFGVEDKKV